MGAFAVSGACDSLLTHPGLCSLPVVSVGIQLELVLTALPFSFDTKSFASRTGAVLFCLRQPCQHLRKVLFCRMRNGLHDQTYNSSWHTCWPFHSLTMAARCILLWMVLSMPLSAWGWSVSLTRWTRSSRHRLGQRLDDTQQGYGFPCVDLPLHGRSQWSAGPASKLHGQHAQPPAARCCKVRGEAAPQEVGLPASQAHWCAW